MRKKPAPYSTDVENPEWTDAMFKTARPAHEVFSPEQFQALIKTRGQRGPQKAPLKAIVKLRIDPDVASYFRAMGKGWQTRMNDALKQFMKDHP